MTPHFQIRGSDGTTVLHENDSCNGAVLWADRYTARGDFGGWDCLFLFEQDCLISTLEPATFDRPKEWLDI